MVIAAMKLKDAPWKKSYYQPRQHIKKQRHYFGPCSRSYGFPSGHVWMWELGYKKSWALKNWCFWTVMLEKTLESPLDCKEIQPVHPKRDQSWIFIGRTDAEAETPNLWPPDVKNWLTEKDPHAGKRLKGGGERNGRGWGGWMASPTQLTWVWASSRSWWWTGRPGVLRFVGSRRVRHDWATELTDHSFTRKSPHLQMRTLILRGCHFLRWQNQKLKPGWLGPKARGLDHLAVLEVRWA